MINYEIYPDEVLGACDVHSNCLECPLPACKYDDEGGYLVWARENYLKSQPHTGLYFWGALAIAEIAAREGFSLGGLYSLIKAGKVDLITHKQLVANAAKIGFSIAQVRLMIKQGRIEMRHADQFPPINMPARAA